MKSNNTIPQINIVLGCLIKERQVLLIRRNEPNSSVLHGFWELPGGKIESGELPKSAVEREVFEETGIIANALEHPIPFEYTIIRKKSPNNVFRVVIQCYRCIFHEGNLLNEYCDKISEARWFDIDKINPVQIQSGSLQFLQYILGQEDIITPPTFNHYLLEYIRLISTKTQNILKDRQAYYSILIHSYIQNDFRGFRLQTSNGRIYGKLRTKESLFIKRDELLEEIKKRLKLRKRNGYQIVAMSNGFPLMGIYNNVIFNEVKYHTNQLKLL